MTTSTLTKASPETAEFTVVGSLDLQVLLLAESDFTERSHVTLHYETDVSTVFREVADTNRSKPASDIYTLKGGKVKLVLSEANDDTSIIVDIRQ